MAYTMEPSFKKRLHKKSPAMQGAILETIQRLDENPMHPSLKVERVRSQPGVWAARIDRANRLLFLWEGEMKTLLNHCSHDILKSR